MSGAENQNLGVQGDKLGYVQLATGIISVSDFTVIRNLLFKEGNRSSLLPTWGYQLPLHLFPTFLTIIVQVSQLDIWRLLHEGCGYFHYQPKFFFSMTGRLKAAIPRERAPTYSSIRGTCSCLQITGTPHHSQET